MAYQKLQARRAAAVVPSDTANIPSISSADGAGNNGCVLYVGVAGDVKVTTAGGDDVVFTGILAGSFIPVQVLKVFSTDTTATNIVALW
jgi:hypothetical protein